MRKIILGLFVIIVLALGGGLLWIASSGEEMIRAGIEREGPKIVGADVALAGISLSPFSGRAKISGLGIANPRGYSDAQAIVVDGISVDLEPLSLFSDIIEIGQISIDNPVIRIEPGKGGTLNLQAIQKNIEAFTGPAPADAPPTPVRIARLDLTGASLVVGGGAIGFSDRSVKLPDISLTDLGGAGGIAPAEAAKKVFTALMPHIREALASGLGAELLSDARARLSSLEGTARETLDKAKDEAGAVLREQTDKLPEGLSEKADEALKSGIGGLLGKKKKQDEKEDGGS